MENKSYKNIQFSAEKRVATVTINRAQFANALDHETLGEIADAFSFAAARDEIGAIVLTGAGKHFSAGGNIKNFKTMLEEGRYLTKEYVSVAGKSVHAIFNTPKPTLAMVNGIAAGQGAAVAAACDFRIFAPSSRFNMAFINVGLSGDSGAMLYLAKLVGIARARELMMTGRVVRADEAKEIGFATAVTESDERLADVTYELAQKLANGATFAIGRQKAMFNSLFYSEYDKYVEMEGSCIEECSRHPDFKEAVYAFCEKRTPVFSK